MIGATPKNTSAMIRRSDFKGFGALGLLDPTKPADPGLESEGLLKL